MQKSIYPWQKNRNRGKMLRGVVSTSVMKDPVLTKTEKQQAYVKESLTRAMQEVRMAKLNGQKLPDARDLLKELDEEDWYGSNAGTPGAAFALFAPYALNQRSPAEGKGKGQKLLAQGNALGFHGPQTRRPVRAKALKPDD